MVVCVVWEPRPLAFPLCDSYLKYTEVSLMTRRRKLQFGLRTFLIVTVVITAVVILNTHPNYPLDTVVDATFSVPAALAGTSYGWPWPCVRRTPNFQSKRFVLWSWGSTHMFLGPLSGNLLVACAMCGTPLIVARWLPRLRTTRRGGKASHR